jgi:hypothetical protein
MRKIILLTILLLTANANAALIDFEQFTNTQNLSNVEVIDGVEFSVIGQTAQTSLRIFHDSTRTSRTSFLLSCDFSAGFGCANDLNVDFKQTVSNVGFDILSEDNGAGEVSGIVTAYLNGSVVGTLNLISDGNGLIHNPIDLSSIGLMDRIVLSSTLDPAGLGYDNFSYESSVVPVPAAIWLFGTGIVGLLGIRKRVSA